MRNFPCNEAEVSGGTSPRSSPRTDCPAAPRGPGKRGQGQILLGKNLRKLSAQRGGGRFFKNPKNQGKAATPPRCPRPGGAQTPRARTARPRRSPRTCGPESVDGLRAGGEVGHRLRELRPGALVLLEHCGRQRRVSGRASAAPAPPPRPRPGPAYLAGPAAGSWRRRAGSAPAGISALWTRLPGNRAEAELGGGASAVTSSHRPPRPVPLRTWGSARRARDGTGRARLAAGRTPVSPCHGLPAVQVRVSAPAGVGRGEGSAAVSRLWHTHSAAPVRVYQHDVT